MAASYSRRLGNLWKPISSIWRPISSQSPHWRHQISCLSTHSIGSPLLHPLVLPFGPFIEPSKNVYIACFGGPSGWFINCVDVEYECNPNGGLLSPKLLLCGKVFNDAAFCIFESTLYVFQGFPRLCSSGYCYEFEPRVTYLKIEESMMQEIGTMISPKYCPKAVPTPDGENILIFSRHPSPEYYFDFELYNPRTSRYEKLPPLRCSVKCARIDLHTFLRDYVLLVQVNEGCRKSCYILDFQLPPPDRCWKNCSGFFGTPGLFLGHNPLILGKYLCLTSTEAYKIDLGCLSTSDTSVNIPYSSGPYRFPEESSLDDDFVSKSIILAYRNVNGGTFCILRTYMNNNENEVGYIPHFVLDVYHCDHYACKEGMKRIYGREDATLPGTKKIKSLSFCIPKEGIFDVSSFSSYNGFI